MARVAKGIEQRGTSLRLEIRWQGERITETHPGKCDAAHIRRVVERREELIARLRVGLPIYEDDVQLLGNVFDGWLGSLAVKRSTHRSYENIWKNYWKQWDRFTPDSITKAMVTESLAKMDVSPKTKRNALTVLSSVLDHADVAKNPCSTIKIKRGQKPPIERYRTSEVSALLDKLEGQALVYFTLLASTGLRPGEALALEWSDWDGEYLSVSKQIVRRRLVKTTKTNVRRRVYVPKWARSAINNHPTRFTEGYVFQNSLGGHHCDTDVFNGAWKRAHSKARVPYRIPYTLRHTRAAELLSQGCLPAKAAKELGHSTQMFLNTYSEFLDEYSNQDTDVLEGVRHQNDTKGSVSA